VLGAERTSRDQAGGAPRWRLLPRRDNDLGRQGVPARWPSQRPTGSADAAGEIAEFNGSVEILDR